jgi:hypothetical protein
MKRSFPVVDADGHVNRENLELREFLPTLYRGIEERRAPASKVPQELER